MHVDVNRTHAGDLGSHAGAIPITAHIHTDHADLHADHAREIPPLACPVPDHVDKSGAIARDTRCTST